MHELGFLVPVLVFLLAGILSAVLLRRMGLSPIIGYFLAGIIIGPQGLGVVEETDTTRFLAGLGVIFLLFDIGLHFSLRRLWEGRRNIFVLAPVQVILAGTVLGGAAWFLGHTVEAAVIIGAGLALSSTAAVMQILTERSEQNSPLGNSAIGILIFQDILVIFLLILVQALGVSHASLPAVLAITLLKVVVVLTAVILIGRFFLGKIFDGLIGTENEEVFTAAVLLVVLATAAITGWAGLSLTLGAFLAGLIISESDFCHMVKTEMRPFRGLLLSFFFITVGMQLDLPVIMEHAAGVALIVLGLVLAKGLTLWGGARLLGFGSGFSLTLGFLLAQGSEFTFVLLALATNQGIIDPAASALLIGVVGASLALTPLIASLGLRLGKHIELPINVESPNETLTTSASTRVLIAGFDQDGHRLARALESEAIDYLAIDHHSDDCTEALCEGFKIAYGHSADLNMFSKVGVDKAHAVVLLIRDHSATLNLVRHLRYQYPKLPLFIRTSVKAHSEELEGHGLTRVALEGDAGLLELGEALLTHLGVSHHRIEKWKKSVSEEIQELGQPISAVPELPL